MRTHCALLTLGLSLAACQPAEPPPPSRLTDQLTLDARGRLLDAAGNPRHGRQLLAGVRGPRTEVLVPIELRGQPTSSVRVTAMLKRGAVEGEQLSLTVPVYDGRGVAHRVTIVLSSTGHGTWEWQALAGRAEIRGGFVSDTIAAGSLTFAADGSLASQTSVSTVNFVNGPANQDVSFDFGSRGALVGTREGDANQLLALESDGVATTALRSWSIDAMGRVSATYEGGIARVVATLDLTDGTPALATR